VPIDVLAERLGTTRGALYETLREARHKLRAELGEPADDLRLMS
jgi:RNA polymerase sigma-70 factor (ECF subfamily)